MRMRWVGAVVVGVVAIGLMSRPVRGQDLNTLLTQWVTSMVNGGLSFPSSVFTITKTALGTTSTDGYVAVNSTAATGGVTVQMSPRTRWRGNAWDTAASQTVDFFAENLPATAATPTGTWKLGYSLNGAAATYPLTVTSAGGVTALGGITAGSTIGLPAANAVIWTSQTRLLSTADKLFQVEDNAGTTGLELNNGTPTLGTCTAGALTSGSHNFAGQYTGNTSGSCVINFGTPNFTNTPFCFAMSTASLTHPRISASSASSITVTGGVSGETIQYFCVGRIGT